MNTVLKIVLSLSFSGSLLILVLLLGRPFLKNRISKQWQYYLWLVVIARLLLPFTTEASVAGTLFQRIEGAAVPAEITLVPGELVGEPEADRSAAQEDNPPPSAMPPVRDAVKALPQYLWLLWLGIALLLLVRKVTVYQGFVKYVRAGRVEVSEIGLLDRFAQIEEQMGLKRPVELYTNRLVSSPLLFGFFRPCVVLPSAGLTDTDFQYTIRHELTHYKRRDMFYRWLVQTTLCLHWFNPFVWLMGREISRACELACDEAVIRSLGPEERRAYGDTLLRAMGAGGSYQNAPTSVMLNESVVLLKERLSAIMMFKKRSKRTAVLSVALTGVLITGAAAAGAYPGPAGTNSTLTAQSDTYRIHSGNGTFLTGQAKRFYEAGSLPGFQMVFYQLSEKEQAAWLEKIYADGKVAFFSVSTGCLQTGSPLIADLAKKLYADGSISFFSILANHMDEAQLESWLDQALEDKNFAFLSMLFGRLKMDDELDELEKELEKQQLDAYQAVGVTKDGKNYYYQGQLVNIFLDHRPDSSFYTLDMNPAGAVDVKIIRDKDGNITGAAYMTEEDRKELFGSDLDGIDIPVDVPKVKSGEYVWLGTYTLDDGDQVYYDVFAETGQQLDVGFAKPGQKTPDPRYYQVSCQREDDELAVASGPMVWGAPVKPGEYSLFVHTEGGSLTNVKGCVTIVKASTDAEK